MQRTLTIAVLVSLVVACSTPVVQSDVPALLTNPGAEPLQEIEQTVSEALGGSKVTLAADVLTKTSLLVIERGMQRGIGRPPELGRDLGRPNRFQLVINRSVCVLVDEQSGRHWPLAAAECIKE